MSHGMLMSKTLYSLSCVMTMCEMKKKMSLKKKAENEKEYFTP